MPHYEYACKDCGEHLEIVQSFKDDPLTECPACQGRLRKVFNPIGISFRGPGFYRTDHRKRSDVKTIRPGESTADSGSQPAGKDSGSGSPADGTSGDKASASPSQPAPTPDKSSAAAS
jgi:putative FmdB family regulatory protein